MATFSIVQREDAGLTERIVADVTGSASYPNPGGEPVAPGDLDARAGNIVAASFQNIPGYAVQLDAANGAMIFIDLATGLEIANAVDLSAVTVRGEFVVSIA